MVDCVTITCTGLQILLAGVTVSKTYYDFDYSEYLGQNYEAGYRKDVRTSTVVSNHVTIFDSHAIRQLTTVSPAMAAGLKANPILAAIAES